MPADDLVEQHILEVGLVCSQWAHLEWLMELTLWWILGLFDKRTEGRILTGQWSLDTTARKVCSLMHLRITDREDLDFIASIKRRIDDIVPKRNLAVHGVRQLDPETETVAAEVSRGHYKNTPQPLSLIRLASLNDELNRIIRDFQPLLVRLNILEDNLQPISHPRFHRPTGSPP